MSDYKDYIRETQEAIEKISDRVVTLRDGNTMSVQASTIHYCSPRNNTGPYLCVEIGMPSFVEPELLKYAEDAERPMNTVYGYVPVRIVESVIEKHGGIISGAIPPFKESK